MTNVLQLRGVIQHCGVNDTAESKLCILKEFLLLV